MEKLFNDILNKKVEVDASKIKFFSSEDQFKDLSIQLSEELSDLLILICSSSRLNEKDEKIKWSRNEAILVGLLTRIYKLHVEFITFIQENKRELSEIIERCLNETIINLLYLIEKNQITLYEEYIKSSFLIDKKCLNLFNKNKNKFEYYENYVEMIKASIEIYSKISNINCEEIPTNFKSIDVIDKYVQLDNTFKCFDYNGYRLGCHSIHGNWLDILLNHLCVHEDSNVENPYSFTSKLDYSPTKATELIIITFEIIIVSTFYIKLQFKDDIKLMKIWCSRLDDIFKRNYLLNSLHLEFEQKNGIKNN